MPCNFLFEKIENMLPSLGQNSSKKHFVLGILSFMAQQTKITENDFKWLDLHSEKVKHLAQVHKLMKCSPIHFMDSVDLTEQSIIKGFLEHFVQKINLVIKKVLDNLHIGHLPAEDIKIICKHYDDVTYVMEYMTGIHSIQIPECQSLRLLLRKYNISIKKVNKL